MPYKNARIHLRVTDEEKQSLVEKATLARQSVSQYILSLSENKTIIVVDGADEVTRQLLKIGKVNLYHFSKIKTTRSDTKNTSPFIKSVRRKQSVLIL